MEPIVEIRKGSEDYPQSLLVLDDLAPDVIYAQGDISLLNKPLLAMLCTTEITEDNESKMHKMLKQFSKYDGRLHWLFSMDYLPSRQIMDYCDNESVILVEKVMTDYTQTYGGKYATDLEDFATNGGLIVEFSYNKSSKRTVQAEHNAMVALAKTVAVPLYTFEDAEVIDAIDYAKKLGKKVSVNKEDLINLRNG